MRLLAASLAFLAAGPAAATDLVASPLAGSTWRVVAIDGVAPELPPSDDNRAMLPSFAFGWRSYGGNAGCNSMGGLYAQIDRRFYTLPGAQTEMACGGARMTQEASVAALFAASPEVQRDGDTAVLTGGGHRLELRRLGEAGSIDPPTAWQGPTVTGQSYVVHAVNGQATPGDRTWSRNPPRLRFDDTHVTMTLDCPGTSRSRFNPNSEHVHVERIEPACALPGVRDGQLAAILNDHPRTVSGPNGELLLASRAGWAILWNERRDRPK